MSKFNKKKSGDLPPVSTASLPDIVFMLLFFFMVATVMRDDEMLVENSLPAANQVEKLEDKKKLVNIYIGKPSSSYQATFGTSDVVQLGDKISQIKDVYNYVNTQRNAMPENLQKEMMVSLKVDKNAKVGVLTDVKEELKEAEALKITYTSTQGDPMNNIKRR